MSSSRDFPFNFSLEVRNRLGPPDRFNLAVRDAFPVVEQEASRRRRGGRSSGQAGLRGWGGEEGGGGGRGGDGGGRGSAAPAGRSDPPTARHQSESSPESEASGMRT
jgi:hypothetical protein